MLQKKYNYNYIIDKNIINFLIKKTKVLKSGIVIN